LIKCWENIRLKQLPLENNILQQELDTVEEEFVQPIEREITELKIENEDLERQLNGNNDGVGGLKRYVISHRRSLEEERGRNLQVIQDYFARCARLKAAYDEWLTEVKSPQEFKLRLAQRSVLSIASLKDRYDAELAELPPSAEGEDEDL